MNLCMDEVAASMTPATRQLVLVERGGLQYFPDFQRVWKSTIGTVLYSRYQPQPPRWLWGAPSSGMVIFDKSTTTGITLLKLKLYFDAFNPLIIGQLSQMHGRAAAKILDLTVEVSFADQELRLRKVSDAVQGKYLLVCDTTTCSNLLRETLGWPVIELPAWEALHRLQVEESGPVVLNLAGEDWERSFLPARILQRPVVGVTTSTDRPFDVCLVTAPPKTKLSKGLAVCLTAEQIAQYFG